MSRNVPSQKVMEKVGMRVAKKIPTPDDMLMVEGSELGRLQYEITKEQWQQQNTGRERGPATTPAARSNQ